MVARDFPCKKCTHAAGRHYVSVSDKVGICLDCVTTKHQDDEDHWHDFEGDNLKFMELQNKRKELRDE